MKTMTTMPEVGVCILGGESQQQQQQQNAANIGRKKRRRREAVDMTPEDDDEDSEDELWRIQSPSKKLKFTKPARLTMERERHQGSRKAVTGALVHRADSEDRLEEQGARDATVRVSARQNIDRGQTSLASPQVNDERRKLRSQESTRFKSDLALYFAEYDEVIGNDPKEDRRSLGGMIESSFTEIG